MIRKSSMVLILGVVVLGAARDASAVELPKNVILMISDGAGYNAWQAASMYEGKVGGQIYDGPNWVTYGCSTFSLTQSGSKTNTSVLGTAKYGNNTPNDTTKSLEYNSTDAWDTTPTALVVPEYYPGGPVSTGAFAGYNYLKSTWTDSAAAGTAISTGQKTYNNAINFSNFGTALPTIIDQAEAAGKATGTISTVQWSHATPASLSDAKNASRKNYPAIANSMLDGKMEVIMGAGNPLFTDDGVLGNNEFADAKGVIADGTADGQDYQYVGGKATWDSLEAGTHASGRTLVQTKGDFEAIAAGTYNGGSLPTKMVGTAQVYQTMQYNRSAAKDWNGSTGDTNNPSDHPTEYVPVAVPAPYPPGTTTIQDNDWDGKFSPVNGDPMNAGVPSLSTMAKGALNVLSQDSDGFFLHIEGGAIDWAGHGNSLSRLVEEQIDFNKSVQDVTQWIESQPGGWNDTLLIVTADHETGMLWGPNSATTAFDPLVDNGVGILPGAAFNTDNHNNQLVPLFARGAGSELFASLVRGVDPIRGVYIDNTDIHTVMSATVPEPSTMATLGCASVLALLALRRRRLNHGRTQS